MTRSVSINRPHGNPRHFKVKGRPTIEEDGRVCLTCKDRDNGATFWISVSPEVVQEMSLSLTTVEPA